MFRGYLSISLFSVLFTSLAIIGSQIIGRTKDTVQFAYIGRCENGMNIYLADFLYRITIPLTSDNLQKVDFVWSPDGDLLAYSVLDRERGIFLITAAGQIRQLTEGRDLVRVWRDATHIEFMRQNEQGRFQAIYLINYETLELQLLSEEIPRSSISGQDYSSSSNGEVRISAQQRDLYIGDVDNGSNMLSRFTMDGSACYEYEPQFRP